MLVKTLLKEKEESQILLQSYAVLFICISTYINLGRSTDSPS